MDLATLNLATLSKQDDIEQNQCHHRFQRSKYSLEPLLWFNASENEFNFVDLCNRSPDTCDIPTKYSPDIEIAFHFTKQEEDSQDIFLVLSQFFLNFLINSLIGFLAPFKARSIK